MYWPSRWCAQARPCTWWHPRYRPAHHLDHFVCRTRDRRHDTKCRALHLGKGGLQGDPSQRARWGEPRVRIPTTSRSRLTSGWGFGRNLGRLLSSQPHPSPPKFASPCGPASARRGARHSQRPRIGESTVCVCVRGHQAGLDALGPRRRPHPLPRLRGQKARKAALGAAVTAAVEARRVALLWRTVDAAGAPRRRPRTAPSLASVASMGQRAYCHRVEQRASDAAQIGDRGHCISCSQTFA